MAVGLNGDIGKAGDADGLVFFFGERLVKVSDILGKVGKLHLLEGCSFASGLCAGNIEQGVKRPDHGLGIRQRLLENRAQRLLVRIAEQRNFDP